MTIDISTGEPARLGLYRFLSRLRPLRSYTSKILLVAFLGTHVPLLALLSYFVVTTSLSTATTVRVLIIALVATLAGTGATLLALHHLLAPISLTSRGLRAYLSNKRLPGLPTDFTDEAGTLMADTEQTVASLDRLIRHLEHYDDLTGLPNRSLFVARVAEMQARRAAHGMVAVIAFDLSRFTQINDGLGREAGDALLRAVAQRIGSSIGERGVLARLGGDEFALADPDCISLPAVTARCEVVKTLFGRPFVIEGRELHVGASLGVTVAPLDEGTAEELLSHAETAVNEAKATPSAPFAWYSEEMNTRMQERLALELELRGALARNELVVHYQPRVDLHAGRIAGVEALVRWQSPTRGMVSPGEFVPLTEENGLIVPIGEWVLRTACAQQRAWCEAGLAPVRVSVNLSARQFAEGSLVETVTAAIRDAGIEPCWLELEVTESLLMDDVERATETLHRLRDLGVSVSLDDFGTGYSSLSYLSRFPIDTLKIDRSFVTHIAAGADAPIADAVIALARSLHLSVTAEGVETQEQLDYLRAGGCDEIQGFYFSPPRPADAVAALLTDGVPGQRAA